VKIVNSEKKQQAPLRYAPVGMTILLVVGTVNPNRRLRDARFVWLTRTQADPLTELSSRPERTRISCHAALDDAACAPFRKERRMKFTEATNLHRKSGRAKWRDLRFFLGNSHSHTPL